MRILSAALAAVSCLAAFADAAPQRRNLLPNPEFDEPIPDATWKIKLDSRGQVLRQETMAMSREWIVRSTGKSYLFMQDVSQMRSKIRRAPIL